MADTLLLVTQWVGSVIDSSGQSRRCRTSECEVHQSDAAGHVDEEADHPCWSVPAVTPNTPRRA
jgi:hypothetical protein